MEKIIVRKDEKRIDIPGYVAFMDVLQSTYDLHKEKPENIKWVSLDTKIAEVDSPPKIAVDVAQDHPQLAIGLFPTVEDKSVTGEEVYLSPVLLKDVRRWKEVSEDLGRYEATGWSGRPGPNAMFEQPRSLIEMLEAIGAEDQITETTAVVEAIALLPIAPNGEFATEFCPQLIFNPSDHKHYRVSIISQDRLNAYARLSEGLDILTIKDMDENQTMFHWKAEFVPDMSDFEKLMSPGSRGHMILVATPYEKPKPLFDPGVLYSRGLHSFGFGDTLSFKGPSLSRSVSAGDVDIGRGSESGKGSLYHGQLNSTEKGNATIYHLRFIGVKPEHTKELTASMLDQLGGSLSGYKKN